LISATTILHEITIAIILLYIDHKILVQYIFFKREILLGFRLIDIRCCK